MQYIFSMWQFGGTSWSLLCKAALTFQFAWLMSVASLWCCAGLYRALTFPRRIDEVNEQGNRQTCLAEVYLSACSGVCCDRSPRIPTLPRQARPSVELGMAPAALIFLVLLGYLVFLLYRH
jgi:hypothetical protein